MITHGTYIPCLSKTYTNITTSETYAQPRNCVLREHRASFLIGTNAHTLRNGKCYGISVTCAHHSAAKTEGDPQQRIIIQNTMGAHKILSQTGHITLDMRTCARIKLCNRPYTLSAAQVQRHLELLCAWVWVCACTYGTHIPTRYARSVYKPTRVARDSLHWLHMISHLLCEPPREPVYDMLRELMAMMIPTWKRVHTCTVSHRSQYSYIRTLTSDIHTKD